MRSFDVRLVDNVQLQKEKQLGRLEMVYRLAIRAYFYAVLAAWRFVDRLTQRRLFVTARANS